MHFTGQLAWEWWLHLAYVLAAQQQARAWHFSLQYLDVQDLPPACVHSQLVHCVGLQEETCNPTTASMPLESQRICYQVG